MAPIPEWNAEEMRVLGRMLGEPDAYTKRFKDLNERPTFLAEIKVALEGVSIEPKQAPQIRDKIRYMRFCVRWRFINECKIARGMSEPRELEDLSAMFPDWDEFVRVLRVEIEEDGTLSRLGPSRRESRAAAAAAAAAIGEPLAKHKRLSDDHPVALAKSIPKLACTSLEPPDVLTKNQNVKSEVLGERVAEEDNKEHLRNPLSIGIAAAAIYMPRPVVLPPVSDLPTTTSSSDSANVVPSNIEQHSIASERPADPLPPTSPPRIAVGSERSRLLASSVTPSGLGADATLTVSTDTEITGSSVAPNAEPLAQETSSVNSSIAPDTPNSEVTAADGPMSADVPPLPTTSPQPSQPTEADFERERFRLLQVQRQVEEQRLELLKVQVDSARYWQELLALVKQQMQEGTTASQY